MQERMYKLSTCCYHTRVCYHSSLPLASAALPVPRPHPAGPARSITLSLTSVCPLGGAQCLGLWLPLAILLLTLPVGPCPATPMQTPPVPRPKGAASPYGTWLGSNQLQNPRDGVTTNTYLTRKIDCHGFGNKPQSSFYSMPNFFYLVFASQMPSVKLAKSKCDFIFSFLPAFFFFNCSRWHTWHTKAPDWVKGSLYTSTYTVHL